jgi:hypothetical protein
VKLAAAAVTQESSNATPIISSDRGVGYFLPPFLVERLFVFVLANYSDPFLQSSLQKDGPLQSSMSRFFEVAKQYAPEQLSQTVNSLAGVLCFVYLLVIVKVCEMQGEMAIATPKLSDLD